MKIIAIALITTLLLQDASTLKILAIVTLPLHSHYMAFQALFKELANRGHSVTVINNFPDDKPVTNMRFINLESKPSFFHNLSTYEQSDPNFLHLYNFYRHVASGDMVKEDCLNLFTNKNARAHRAERALYDVIFVEQFMSECGLAYAGALYDAPIIGITSHVLLPWGYPRLGIPFDVASHPFYFNDAGPTPTLYHKLESAVLYFLFNTLAKWANQKGVYEVFQEQLPDYQLDIEALARDRMRMMFVYQHPALTGARLSAPQLLDIAGIHIARPKPVPEDIEKFLSDAKHGAIYVSFGSNLKSETMSKEKRQQFLDAFMKIPQKVIWKIDSEGFPEGYDKIYTGKWMPQLDILCDARVVGFVCQGGMLSLSEAARCGTPLVAMPFFGDQFSNAAAARAASLARSLPFQRATAPRLAAALQQLATPEMQQNAKRVQKLFLDRPQPVMESAIYWTEYVARHRQAPPSLTAKNLSWFQHFHIDVYIVAILLLSLIFIIVYLLLVYIKLLLMKLIALLSSKKKVKRS